MNRTRLEAKQRLLDEVLPNDPGAAGAEAAKQHALAAFRRGTLQKRIAMISRLAAVIVALAAGCFLFRTSPTKNRPLPPGPAVSGPAKATGATEAVVSTTVPTLTDEQLLASFPPDTCYLAEVDGRKILVFADSTVRGRFLH